MKTRTTRPAFWIVTTPRANGVDNLAEWLDWGRRSLAPHCEGCAVGFLAAVPAPPSEEVAVKLNRLLPGGDACWVAMAPGHLGPGDTFRAACAFAFDRGADYVLHVPIDVSFGVERAKDALRNVHRLLGPVLAAEAGNPADLVVGDYAPRIHDEGSNDSIPAFCKHEIEQHVLEQLGHYFPGSVVERLGIRRPRTELFVVGRRLFEAAHREGRFWPWDPIPQLLIYAERKDFRVENVDIGVLNVDDPSDPARVQGQVWRTAMQISSEWLRWERELDPGAAAIAQKAVRWEQHVAEGNRLAFGQLTRILTRAQQVRQDPGQTVSTMDLDLRKCAESYRNRHNAAPGVTAVACYDPDRRPEAFAGFLRFVRSELEERLGLWLAKGWLTLVPEDRLHWTILGLEARWPGLANLNLVERGRRAGVPGDVPPMDLPGLASYLGCLELPAPLQFGGYPPDLENPTDTSPPYRRGFHVKPNGQVVVVGWPKQFAPALSGIRKALEVFHCVHKYHVNPQDVDNDAFLVLAEVTDRPEQGGTDEERARFVEDLTRARNEIRAGLAKRCFEFAITADQCAVVRYPSVDLARTPDTEIIPFPQLTPERFRQLYRPTSRSRASDLVRIHRGSAEPYRGVYLMAEHDPARPFALAQRLSALYAGTIPPTDALHSFLWPRDQRGEVIAWAGPHFTLLDAYAVSDGAEYDRRVREVLTRVQALRLVATGLAVFGPALVIRYRCEASDGLRGGLRDATADLVARHPLTDDQIQKAYWWIESQGPETNRCAAHLAALDRALLRYRQAKSPPLQASRHFGIQYLLRCSKALDRANRALAAAQANGAAGTVQECEDKVLKARNNLDYYFLKGIPAWYAGGGSLHLTVASGLPETGLGGAAAPDLRELEPDLLRDSREYVPVRVAIVGEDFDSPPVQVKYFDWLTETYVEETRPGFRVLEDVAIPR
jgi:hypothetical protein